MTSLDERIINALSPVVETVRPNLYEGQGKEYIVYVYEQYPDILAESKADLMRCSISLSWYLPKGVNPRAKRKQITSAIVEAGFTPPSIMNASDEDGQCYVFEFEGLDDAE